MKIKALREKRGELAKRIRQLADLANDEGHAWSAEDEANWTAVNADYEAAGKKLAFLERAEAVEKVMEARATEGVTPGTEDRVWSKADREGEEAEADETDEDLEERQPEDTADREFRGPKNLLRARNAEDERLAMNAFCRMQLGMEITPRLQRACERAGVNLRRPYLDLMLRRGNYNDVRRENRAAMGTTVNIGGETIPAGFVPQFERALLQFDGVRQVAEVLRTASGNELTWPTTNDTTNKGALLAENTATTDVGVATDKLTLNAYKYTSKIILISAELLEDSAFDLPSMIGSMAGERIGRILADHFTTGTGTAQPKGVVVASTLGKTTAGATAITAEEVIDLIHSVDPAYRANASFMMHDGVLLYLKKLKFIADGQFIFVAPQDGGPGRIFGHPYTINQSMQATVATATKTMLFGDMSKYKIRDVGSLRLRRLVERYAEYDQEGFVAFSRHDGDLLNAGTNPVKHMLQA